MYLLKPKQTEYLTDDRGTQMGESFLRELMHVYSRDGNGYFCMLECYLDDSGTHCTSRAIVWAGIAGHQQYMADFEAAWNARLKAPCENLPAISQFHSAELGAGLGEFAGYSRGARDLTRRNFRKVIVDAGLSFVSFGVSVDDWKEQLAELPILRFMSPEQLVLGQAIMTVCGSAHKNEHVSFQFDKGRSEHVSSIILPAIEESGVAPELVSHGFSSVSQNVGLQAADLVAHETYKYFLEYLESKDSEPDAHLKRLVEDSHDNYVGWLGQEEISKAITSFSSA